MKTKNTGRNPQEVQEKRIKLDLPDISDQVPYTYANHTRIASSKYEVRLAFGEMGPTGKLEPRIGVVLSHLSAKGLMSALTRIVENLEKKVGEIKDPDASGATPKPAASRSSRKN